MDLAISIHRIRKGYQVLVIQGYFKGFKAKVCEISHSVRNCLSVNLVLSPEVAPPLDFTCYAKFSHSHVKMLVVGFLPLVFFLAPLIGLETYCQA